MIQSAYHVMGNALGGFGLWLTFCDNGGHFGSCLHLYWFLKEDEEIVYVGCATVGLLRRHVVCEVKPHAY
jgi:hypothetical protein